MSGNFTFKAVLVVVSACLLQINAQEECDTNLENMLASLVSPDEPQTMQIQALRNELIRRIKEAKQREELENELLQYKRSLSSLARWNNMPGKRNLESLARAGYIRTLPTTDEPDYKRNFMPTRSIRNAQTSGDGQFAYYDIPMYKRNVAALARSGMKIYGKRNVAALLRQDNYLNSIREGRSEIHTEKPSENYDEKRNIASIKAQYKPKFKRSVSDKRIKREADYYDMANEEYPSPVYQSPYDYDEDKDGDNEYQDLGKRFLVVSYTSKLLESRKLHVPPE
ncbi:hypothetical protein MML48_8g00019421 [Holotrichia oblita]|uniref:Uncharacterized protein n=1 Tax=Holotrichia oblita TaxID=644536 RepID=A0ACB9SNA9_HOLOL|nr:hypothetical protein MML48_8g00019421 [Holotrichia oblita]